MKSYLIRLIYGITPGNDYNEHINSLKPQINTIAWAAKDARITPWNHYAPLITKDMSWVRQSMNVTNREMVAEPQGIYSMPCDYMAAGNPG